MATQFCVVTIAAPVGKTAQRLALALVKQRLAACVTIVARVESHYRWKGKLESAKESLLIVKTRRSLVPALEKRVSQLHPYDVPEIISLPVLRGNKAYLKWLADET